MDYPNKKKLVDLAREISGTVEDYSITPQMVGDALSYAAEGLDKAATIDEVDAVSQEVAGVGLAANVAQNAANAAQSAADDALTAAGQVGNDLAQTIADIPVQINSKAAELQEMIDANGEMITFLYGENNTNKIAIAEAKSKVEEATTAAETAQGVANDAATAASAAKLKAEQALSAATAGAQGGGLDCFTLDEVVFSVDNIDNHADRVDEVRLVGVADDEHDLLAGLLRVFVVVNYGDIIDLNDLESLEQIGGGLTSNPERLVEYDGLLQLNTSKPWLVRSELFSQRPGGGARIASGLYTPTYAGYPKEIPGSTARYGSRLVKLVTADDVDDRFSPFKNKVDTKLAGIGDNVEIADNTVLSTTLTEFKAVCKSSNKTTTIFSAGKGSSIGKNARVAEGAEVGSNVNVSNLYSDDYAIRTQAGPKLEYISETYDISGPHQLRPKFYLYDDWNGYSVSGIAYLSPADSGNDCGLTYLAREWSDPENAMRPRLITFSWKDPGTVHDVEDMVWNPSVERKIVLPEGFDGLAIMRALLALAETAGVLNASVFRAIRTTVDRFVK